MTFRYSRGQRTGQDAHISQQDERARTRREGALAKRMVPTATVTGAHYAEPWSTVVCDTTDGGLTVYAPPGREFDEFSVHQWKGANAITITPREDWTVDNDSTLVVLATGSTAHLRADALRKNWMIV